MTEDESAESPLITAIRNLGRQVAAEVHASARHVVVSIATLAAMVVLVLAAAAVSACIGMVYLARGLHTLLQILTGIGWVADLLSGIIITALPLVAIAIARRHVQPQRNSAPSATHSAAK